VLTCRQIDWNNTIHIGGSNEVSMAINLALIPATEIPQMLVQAKTIEDLHRAIRYQTVAARPMSIVHEHKKPAYAGFFAKPGQIDYFVMKSLKSRGKHMEYKVREVSANVQTLCSSSPFAALAVALLHLN
jgi:hypothetical protein